MERAYTTLDVRAVNDEERTIEGIASTPSPDRMEDVVEPLGAQFKLPMPLLWQHDHRAPIGHVTFAKPTKAGIPFKAKLARVAEPGALRDRLEEAWQSVKAELIRFVSIGFRPLEMERLDDGGIRFKTWEWLELSLVTIPANAEASITNFRSIDAELRAASGQPKPAPDRGNRPSALGPKSKSKDTPMGKSIAEQIAGFEASRVAKAAQMADIMEKAGETGETLDAEQTETYDTLEGEVKAIDDHLRRLNALEKAQAAKAKPVEAVTTTETGTAVRGGAVVASIKTNLPPATAFTRYVVALARAKGNLMQAFEIAKGWQDTPEVEQVLKAAVAAGTTTDPAWAGPLVQYQQMASEFIELLRPETIIGRIPNLRRVPFNISMPAQTTGSTVGWVGEGAPKPVSALAFSTVTLRFAKAAGIVVLTDELVRFSNPSAEAIVRQDLIAAMAQFLDRQFVDPDVAAVANVSPASITNGVTPVVASGTTADDLKADLQALFAQFLAANLSLSSAVFIMTSQMALTISMMQNPLGQPEFPGITMNGGTLWGVPVITSENIPPEAGEVGPPEVPAGTRIILAKASEIMLADDGGVTIDASREASLQMDSAPTNPPAAATVLVSLWQMNMIGLRAERFINWQRRRPQAVAYINGAAYTF